MRIETECDDLQRIKTQYLIDKSPKTIYEMLKKSNVIVFLKIRSSFRIYYQQRV